jgi:hypothetical protein
MQNIFNIGQEYLELLNIIEESEGEITDEIAEFLKENETDRDNALDNLSKLVKHLSFNNKIIDDEVSRLKMLSTRNDNNVNKIKDAIMSLMKLYDLRGKSGNYSHKTPLYTLFTRATQSIEIDFEKIVDYDPITGTKTSKYIEYNIQDAFDATKIKELKPEKYSPKIDKASIKEALVPRTTKVDLFNNIEELDTLEEDLSFASITTKESLTIR